MWLSIRGKFAKARRNVHLTPYRRLGPRLALNTRFLRRPHSATTACSTRAGVPKRRYYRCSHCRRQHRRRYPSEHRRHPEDGRRVLEVELVKPWPRLLPGMHPPARLAMGWPTVSVVTHTQPHCENERSTERLLPRGLSLCHACVRWSQRGRVARAHAAHRRSLEISLYPHNRLAIHYPICRPISGNQSFNQIHRTAQPLQHPLMNAQAALAVDSLAGSLL